jgi:hypothetical protein
LSEEISYRCKRHNWTETLNPFGFCFVPKDVGRSDIALVGHSCTGDFSAGLIASPNELRVVREHRGFYLNEHKGRSARGYQFFANAESDKAPAPTIWLRGWADGRIEAAVNQYPPVFFDTSSYV